MSDREGPRSWRIASGAAALLLWAGCSQGRDAPPDVVLVVVDTLRADRLSCYGYPRSTSPFMDRLAAEGVLFEDVTAQFSWTLPSMVSMFSGQYVTDWREVMTPDVPCLAQSFADAGYRTLGVVSNQVIDQAGGFARGFDHFDSSPSDRPGEPSDDDRSRDLSELVDDLWPHLAPLAEGERGKRAPLFIYVHALEPHHPYLERDDLAVDLPPGESVAVQPPGWQASALEGKGAVPRDGREDWSEDLADLRRQRGLYDHEVRATDERLEDFFARLEAIGVLDNAVVAIVSDHGEGLWDHTAPLRDRALRRKAPHDFFYRSHGATLYQEAIATPMILRGPGVPSGRRVQTAVENVDLFPTLLELCGIAAPHGLHGRSAVPLLEDTRTGSREVLFSFGTHGLTAVRETATGLKLVVPNAKSRDRGHAPQLFDLRRDSYERHDLYSSRPDDAARLMDAWARWRDRHPTGEIFPFEGLKRTDLEHLERLRRLGYTDLDLGGD